MSVAQNYTDLSQEEQGVIHNLYDVLLAKLPPLITMLKETQKKLVEAMGVDAPAFYTTKTTRDDIWIQQFTAWQIRSLPILKAILKKRAQEWGEGIYALKHPAHQDLLRTLGEQISNLLKGSGLEKRDWWALGLEVLLSEVESPFESNDQKEQRFKRILNKAKPLELLQLVNTQQAFKTLLESYQTTRATPLRAEIEEMDDLDGAPGFVSDFLEGGEDLGYPYRFHRPHKDKRGDLSFGDVARVHGQCAEALVGHMEALRRVQKRLQQEPKLSSFSHALNQQMARDVLSKNPTLVQECQDTVLRILRDSIAATPPMMRESVRNDLQKLNQILAAQTKLGIDLDWQEMVAIHCQHKDNNLRRLYAQYTDVLSALLRWLGVLSPESIPLLNDLPHSMTWRFLALMEMACGQMLTPPLKTFLKEDFLHVPLQDVATLIEAVRDRSALWEGMAPYFQDVHDQQQKLWNAFQPVLLENKVHVHHEVIVRWNKNCKAQYVSFDPSQEVPSVMNLLAGLAVNQQVCEALSPVLCTQAAQIQEHPFVNTLKENREQALVLFKAMITFYQGVASEDFGFDDYESRAYREVPWVLLGLGVVAEGYWTKGPLYNYPESECGALLNRPVLSDPESLLRHFKGQRRVLEVLAELSSPHMAPAVAGSSGAAAADEALGL